MFKLGQQRIISGRGGSLRRAAVRRCTQHAADPVHGAISFRAVLKWRRRRLLLTSLTGYAVRVVVRSLERPVRGGISYPGLAALREFAAAAVPGGGSPGRLSGLS
jgi:hypothetical protein